jgi:hypothetical protein
MPADILEKPATVEDVAREVSKIRSIVTDAVEGGVRSARQAIKHGRYAAEDVIEEAQHAVEAEAITGNGHSFRCRSLGRGLSGLDWIPLSLSAGYRPRAEVAPKHAEDSLPILRRTRPIQTHDWSRQGGLVHLRPLRSSHDARQSAIHMHLRPLRPA